MMSSLVAALLAVAPSTALPAHAAPPVDATTQATTKNFHFDNIPIRSALQLLAEEGQFNLVVSDSVKGNISLRLKDVTWEQAFAIVLQMKGLGYRVDGGGGTVTVTGG